MMKARTSLLAAALVALALRAVAGNGGPDKDYEARDRAEREVYVGDDQFAEGDRAIVDERTADRVLDRVLDEVLGEDETWRRDRVIRGDRIKGSREELAERAGIPPGHLPPPGECREWQPGVPPGQQPPPFKC